MPAELTGSVRHASRWWLARDLLIVLVAFALVGALGGVVWEAWWTPPTGVVVDGAWVPADPALPTLFEGTAQYVVVALLAGLVTGLGCAWFVDRSEVVTLLAVVAGSVLGAWVMLQVGTALAPPDPATAARGAADGAALPGTLGVSGAGALGSMPAGALTGLVLVFIGLTPNRAVGGVEDRIPR